MILKSLKKNYKVKKGFIYSSFTGKKISEKQYEHVIKAWDIFEMETMKDSHNLYFKCDALLLDMFEKFRNTSIKKHGLCPSYYQSFQDLSWNAMLNTTKVELVLIQTLTCIYSVTKK